MLRRSSFVPTVVVFLPFLAAPSISAPENIDELRSRAEQGYAEAQSWCGAVYREIP